MSAEDGRADPTRLTGELPPYPLGAAPVWRPLPHHPRATLALALGIVSVVGALVGVTLVLGPLAWYFGVSTMRAIDREPARWSGRGNAQAGLVMGIVATALLAVAMLVLLLVAGITAVLTTVDSGY